MKKTLVFGLFLVLFFSVNASAIASCASESYYKSCRECPIDSYGKMDENCYEANKNEGLVCVGDTYKVMAALYGLKMCPAIDVCSEELERCINLRCPGTDAQDCENLLCKTCYFAVDRCVYRASFDCSGEAKCGDGKCEKNKGENMEACCLDCGCPKDLKCKYDGCMSQELIHDAEAGNQVTTTLIPIHAGEAETIFDWMNQVCGYQIFLLVPLLLMGGIVEVLK